MSKKSILSTWPPVNRALYCNLCEKEIKTVPLFRNPNSRTKYYHLECAKSVNLL